MCTICKFTLQFSVIVILLAGCASVAQAPPAEPATANQVSPAATASAPVAPRLTPEKGEGPGRPVERSPATPELIEAAFQSGQINAGERLVYLAYAIYEPESLPSEYHSPSPWDGTMVVRELRRSTQSEEDFCKLDQETRGELGRLLQLDFTCNP